MDYAQLAPQLQTGDIFLFGGTSPISKLIDAMTHSPFSHIGMVVRTPGSSGLDGLSIWQSYEPEGGVVTDNLATFLTKYVADQQGETLTARQLAVTRTPAMIAALDGFMVAAKGRPFPDYAPWLITYLSGCLGIPSAETAFYCSELVAQSYMTMGLLKAWPYASVYSPGRFCIEAYDLQLQLGASLGPEIPVTAPAAAA